MTQNKVVLLGVECPSTRILYHHLSSQYGPIDTVLEQPEKRWTYISRRARRLGWKTVAGQIAFKAAVEPVLIRRARRRISSILSQANVRDAPLPEDAVTVVWSANDPNTQNLLRELDPAVVVLSGTRILHKSTLRCVQAPFINIHAGITPRYRGVHGAYWALVAKEPDACGVTVHLVDEGIDTGGILHQICVEPTPEDSFVTYPILQLTAALPLLDLAIDAAMENRLEVQPPLVERAPLRTHPTALQYLRYRLAQGVR